MVADLRVDELALVLGDVRRVGGDDVDAAVELGKRVGCIRKMQVHVVASLRAVAAKPLERLFVALDEMHDR